MRKRSKKELFDDIVQCLKTGSKNKNEIKNDIEANWSTVKENLALLETLNLVEQTGSDYRLNNAKLEDDDETMGGVPFSNETKEHVKHIASQLCTIWKQRTNALPPKTWLQKSVARYAQLSGDDQIPLAWYLFGEVAPIHLNPETLSCTQNITINREKGETVVSEFEDKSKDTLLSYYYEQAEKHDYLAKLEADTALNGDINEPRFVSAINDILFYYDFDKGKKIFEILQEMTSYLSKLTIETNIETGHNRRLFEQLYDQFWMTYAKNQYKLTFHGGSQTDQDLVREKLEEDLAKPICDFKDIAQSLD